MFFWQAIPDTRYSTVSKDSIEDTCIFDTAQLCRWYTQCIKVQEVSCSSDFGVRTAVHERTAKNVLHPKPSTMQEIIFVEKVFLWKMTTVILVWLKSQFISS